jgi:DNA-binding GntR family transcriptional regulator
MSAHAVAKSKSSRARSRPTTENLYVELKRMILSFELRPGARFTETELADRFCVSRTPIREVLLRLEAEHYLTIRPKQGCFVRDIDIDELTQRYQVRIELELLSLQLAHRYMPQHDLERLAEDWKPAAQHGRSAKPDLMLEREESFHLRLAAGGRNRALYEYISDINHHIRIVRRLDFTSGERIDTTYAEHHRIVCCLLQHDLKSAQRLMRDHITHSMEFSRSLTLLKLAQLRARHRV